MSAFFPFQHTLDKLFKFYPYKPSLIRVKIYFLVCFWFSYNDRLLIETTSLFVASANDTEENNFLEEINLMKSIGFHKNIVNLIGASTQMKPLCLVLEYMPHGDLLHYLRKKNQVSLHRFSIYYYVCFTKIFSYYFSLGYSTQTIPKIQMIDHY